MISPRKKQRIKQQLKKGGTYEGIGKKEGVSPQTVRKIAKACEIIPKSAKKWEEAAKIRKKGKKQCIVCKKKKYRREFRKGIAACKKCSRKYRDRQKIKMQCKQCGKTFKTRRSRGEKGEALYCSTKCGGLAQRKRKIVTCGNCGIKLEKTPGELKKHKHHFCSPKCYSNYNRTTGYWFICEQCGKNFWRKHLRPDKNRSYKYCSKRCCSQSKKNKYRTKPKKGTKYGRWTVVREGAPKYWTAPSSGRKSKIRRYYVRCECGKRALVTLSGLRSGTTKSCGCLGKEKAAKRDKKGMFKKRAQKRVGTTVRGLYVEELLPGRTKRGHHVYRCTCVHCGKKKTYGANALSPTSAKNNTGCGCQQHSLSTRKKRGGTIGKHFQQYGGSIGRNEKSILTIVEKMLNTKLKRQYPMGSYFVDGYSIDYNLVVEVDESHHKHPEVYKYDRRREKRIKEEYHCDVIRVKDIMRQRNTSWKDQKQECNKIIKQYLKTKEK